MREYKNYLKQIQTLGYNTRPARDKMPSVIMLPTHQMTFYFEDGVPILTGKKMPFYSILGELICFIRGCTDVRDYDKMGCSVWWDNAYKWNISELDRDLLSRAEYVHGENIDDSLYSLGRIYAAQWRRWATDRFNTLGHIDQLKNLINSMIHNPSSRYHVMTAWNPAEMNKDDVSQPNCHVYFQASMSPSIDNTNWDMPHYTLYDDEVAQKLVTRNPTQLLFTHLTQRSCDAFLGVPFNITSYSLLTILLSIWTNSIPIQFDWVGVNNHIYSDHEVAVAEYRTNPHHQLPRLWIDIDRCDTLEKVEQIKDLATMKEIFKLIDYECEDKISAPLSVGL